MPRITKPVEERRQEIIDTAKKLFAENGYDKTQVADISKSMNVAQGLIYHYFKSKTNILYAVIDELAAEQTETMKRALEKSNGSAVERLLLLLSKRPDYECYGRLIPSLTDDRAIMDYCVKKMTAYAIPLLLSLIERGNADGSWNCAYPKETAVFIMQGMGGVVGVSKASGFDGSKSQMFSDIIFRVLGLPPPPQ